MKRTLSQKFAKQKDPSFGNLPVDDASKGGKRRIKALFKMVVHGVHNVPQTDSAREEEAVV